MNHEGTKTRRAALRVFVPSWLKVFSKFRAGEMVRWNPSKILLPLVPLAVACAFAEVAVRRAWVPAYLVPAPSQVLKVFTTDRDLWKATRDTALASVAGFLLSAV